MIRRKAKPGTTEKCAVHDCWQPVKCAGLCGACYSWWNRASLRSAGEFSDYCRRVDRMVNRISGRGAGTIVTTAGKQRRRGRRS